jgi:hypothetical protein
MILVLGVWAFVRTLLVSSAAVSLENVALRHQLAVMQRSVGRSRLQYRLDHRHRKDSHCVDEWQCSGAVSASNQRLKNGTANGSWCIITGVQLLKS